MNLNNTCIKLSMIQYIIKIYNVKIKDIRLMQLVGVGVLNCNVVYPSKTLNQTYFNTDYIILMHVILF